MGLGILLMAAGAVMTWGLNTDSTGSFNLDTIGMFLFLIGIVATLLSLAFWSSWGGSGVSRRTTRYENDGAAPKTYNEPVGGAPGRATVHEEARNSRF